nr:ribonuclease H-like domain, reverse transcriptase, RNA-dependent DNA polymerase [Tanacetum cinerariifolium]
DPTTGTYNVEKIRRERPENITASEWDKYNEFWNDPRNIARAAQNRQNRAKSTVISRQRSRSLARLRDEMEEVYVTQPERFIQQGNSEKVYKLTKALYGLRQAPQAWNVKLDQTLKSLDFKKCNLEQAVYTKRSKTSTLIVGVYVDDLIITGTPKKEIDLFKS